MAELAYAADLSPVAERHESSILSGGTVYQKGILMQTPNDYMLDPPDDPDVCEDCGTKLEHDVDGDRDGDGNVYAIGYTYCPNQNCGVVDED